MSCREQRGRRVVAVGVGALERVTDAPRVVDDGRSAGGDQDRHGPRRAQYDAGVEEEFLTVAEVAELLKLNRQTIRNWIESGQLPAYRIGRRVRISRTDFDGLITRGQTSDGAAPAAAGASIWDGEIPLPQTPR